MEVNVMQDILGKNDALAETMKADFAARRIFVLNLMGSPGSGKTTLMEATLRALASELRIAVIEGDLFTSKDADRIGAYGVQVVQINTAGGCHLDAPMVEKALASLGLDNLDLIVIENVGNLVCPAEFALGEDAKAVVLSVAEGDDKPMKYPLMFKESAVALINKTDLLPFTNFDLPQATEDIRTIHPGAEVLPVSATRGDGLEAWLNWLRGKVKAKKEGTA
ncbi:MAG: hydrogenase nickel incorporation protein HypB [Schwartzia sp.]|nr:hydrogenase nickel incorporation protein HypB [Schwartzia sp. (in: firmicutes)]MBR1886512.1 hydrogenase nickel incorporation protein HypB [Schwartzia sp. (in: firmicutes)]